MTRTLATFALAAAAVLSACSEQGLNAVGTGNSGVDAQIEVTPPLLEFGELSSTDTPTIRSFTIKSVGSADLVLDAVTASGDGRDSYTILTDVPQGTVLPPGTEMDVEVAFSPYGAHGQEGLAQVISNDEDDSKEWVELFGEGLVPELEIAPDPLDFGAQGLGCEITDNLSLSNVGTEALTITDISHSGADFTLTQSLGLPLTLLPDESAQVQLTFAPSAEAESEGVLSVTSTEPLGTRTAEQSGRGISEGEENMDRWELPDTPKTDIMFSLDSSCSMTWDIIELYNNFDAFINELEGLDANWQVIVVNEDDGCTNADILTPSTPDVGARFQEALFGWNWSSDYTEALLTVNEAGVQKTDSGECNDGFMRSGAMLHIIDISDEPEQSASITGRDWSDLTDSIVTKKGDLALTTISAIAGDYPGGCDDASAGDGYYQAVQATNGVFISICQDWANTYNLGLLAEASVSQNTFVLSQPADESTIEVKVNDAVRSNGWEFRGDDNAVVFSENVPTAGDVVKISYWSTGACEQ